jgi:hypothetical protein
VPKLFGVTLFVSATLLFLVQPMVGKMILPLVGGTPGVWNTCMVFFQALLLAGYYYAHKTSGNLPTSKQVKVHATLLVVTVGALAVGAALIENNSPVPIVKSLAPQGSTVPFFGVLLLLAVAIGLPFFTVSTTAPLLQKWFSETGHPSAKDPYFLYAASNFGSLLALIGYPFLVEPNLRLVEQAWMWAIGFVALVVLIWLCGRAVVHAPPLRQPAQKPKHAPRPVAEPPPHWSTKLRWLALAAVPSSLMLAVTTQVTTDMVSMPLLWVIPLALYLLTFIIVFSKTTPAWVHLGATLATPVLILLVVFTRVAESGFDFSGAPKLLQYFLNVLPFLTFFFVALTCHGELARTRPSPQHLTEFYLIMSFGGMVGGLFNALFAPVVFTFVSEYPISLVVAAFLLPRLKVLVDPEGSKTLAAWTPRDYYRTMFWDVIAFLIFFAAARFLSAYFDDIREGCLWLINKSGIKMASKTAATIIVYGIPILASYFLVERPYRFGAVVGAIWLGTFLTFLINERKRPEEYRAIHERSFFGVMKVEPYRAQVWIDDQTAEKSPIFMRLVHGTTVHGMQHHEADGISIGAALWPLGMNTPADALGLAWIAEPNYRFPGREPLTYYHRTGPVGAIFDAFWQLNEADPRRNREVACVGLGTGSLSCYARPRERMTFFEIDWAVRKLVDREVNEEDGRFTYLKRARQQGADIEFMMGDARLSLEQTDRKWGLMLVDAFSSDSIPAHLLTLEAVQLYFDRLSENGLLALHISNRYLKLEPVVEMIVRKLGYAAIVMHDSTTDAYVDGKPEFSGKLASTWILVARTREAFGPLSSDPRWGPLKAEDSVGLWTDDYTPITKAFREGWATLLNK